MDRPDLQFVGVGVSRYPNLPDDFQLPGADHDVEALAQTFQAMQGTSYAHVSASVLEDEKATPDAIRSALASLAQMKSTDLAVVFFAGHGVPRKRDKRMVYVTAGVAWGGQSVREDSLDSASIGWDDIAASIGRARGRVVVLLDACHSGGVTDDVAVPNEALASALAREGRAGAVVFAAAKGRQVSLEGSVAGVTNRRGLVLDAAARALVLPSQDPTHGFFTGAVLASLADPATDRDQNGSVEMSELVAEVRARVRQATGGAQTPWIAYRDLFGDFAIARAAKAAPR
jgi:uncharacterized caspase-like protein